MKTNRNSTALGGSRPSRPACSRLVGIVSVAAVMLCGAQPCAACQIPVFRYALERWRPDPYEATIVYKGELTDEQLVLVDRLSNAQFDEKSPLNLVVRQLDLAAATPEETELLYKRTSKPESLPWLVLDYPFNSRTPQAAWAGPLTEDNLTALVDSPARQKIRQLLLAGESAVWVLLECGDKEKDDAAAAMISEQLKANQDELKLPEQDVIQNDEFFQEGTAIPLRLAFSMIRLARDDPAEQIFAKTMSNAEKDLPDDEPIVMPVFGRGRSYFAMVGKGINEENIASDCGFLTGPCSCRVKAENPGVDFLMAVDWERHITETPAKEIELPELSGLAGLVAAADQQQQDVPESNGPGETAVAAETPAPQEADTSKTTAETDPTAQEADGPEKEVETSLSKSPDDEGTASDPAPTDDRELAFASRNDDSLSDGADAVESSEAGDAAQSAPEASTSRQQLPLWMPIAAVTFFGALVVVFGTVIVKLRSQ